MINWIKEQLKSICKTMIHNIAWVILGSAVSVSAILVGLNTTLDTLFLVAHTPVQLWEAIALALLVSVYIYLRTVRTHSLESPVIESFFNSSGFKWKLLFKTPKNYEVSYTPMCIKHDKNLIEINNAYVCNVMENDQLCTATIPRENLIYFHRIAESDIEHIIRNNF